MFPACNLHAKSYLAHARLISNGDTTDKKGMVIPKQSLSYPKIHLSPLSE